MRSLMTKPFKSPFRCAVVCTAGYPTYPSGKAHGGEDYVPKDKSNEANWSLYSPCEGKVYISKKQTGNYTNGYGAYGNYLVIQADNGYWVLMAHLQRLPVVKVGQRVLVGQLVGVAGATGNAGGRHLHIEVSDMRNVKYNSATWYTEFVAHRVKPSDYIDFGDYNFDPKKEDDFDVKTWKNGSTPERVYQTTTTCKAQGKDYIGSLAPREVCNCYGIVDGCYIVAYKVNGTTAYKTGFVKYSGGVK